MASEPKQDLPLLVSHGETSCGDPCCWAWGHHDPLEFAQACVASPEWGGDRRPDEPMQMRDEVRHERAVPSVCGFGYVTLNQDQVDGLGLHDKLREITTWAP